jgi:hypothetical protein
VENNYIYNAGGKEIKHIMGNWELTIENNFSSDSRIVPPFFEETGPVGTGTNGIKPEDLYLNGKVIDCQNDSLVELLGDWERKMVTGFWGLFEFDFLKSNNKNKAEAVFTLPVEKPGLYKLCILYLPEEDNATNATIEVIHAGGRKELKWNMREGDKHGFALEIGKFRFTPDSQSKITISNSGADGDIVADAISFIKVKD